MTDALDKHLDRAFAALDDLSVRELEATAAALERREDELRSFSSIFRDVAGARVGGRSLSLTRYHLRMAVEPDFSPDGRWIVVRSKESVDTAGNLWLISRNGLIRRQVTHDPAGTAKWLSASFSPNGERITAGRIPIVGGEQQNPDVFRVRLDGSRMHNLTNTPNIWESAADWGSRP